MDIATLARIDALHRPRVIAPLGTGYLLKRVMPQSRVSEHDWVTFGSEAPVRDPPPRDSEPQTKRLRS